MNTTNTTAFEDSEGRDGAAEQGRDVELKPHAVSPYTIRPETFNDAEMEKLACATTARKARDSFSDACQLNDPINAEASFSACTDAISELWGYVPLKGRPFQDLLGLLAAATKKRDFSEIDQQHHDTFQAAFWDLAKYFVEEEDVQSHRKRFAEVGIDILRPLQSANSPRLRITIEEIDDEVR